MSYRSKISKTKRVQKDFLFSHNDRITYVYLRNLKDNSIIEIINVSYDVLIKKKWHTIVRYESHHGYLHRHVRLSLKDEKGMVEPIQVPGTHSDWLTWAIQDLLKNFGEYKQTFFDKNSIVDNSEV